MFLRLRRLRSFAQANCPSFLDFHLVKTRRFTFVFGVENGRRARLRMAGKSAATLMDRRLTAARPTNSVPLSTDGHQWGESTPTPIHHLGSAMIHRARAQWRIGSGMGSSSNRGGTGLIDGSPRGWDPQKQPYHAEAGASCLFRNLGKFERARGTSWSVDVPRDIGVVLNKKSGTLLVPCRDRRASD